MAYRQCQARIRYDSADARASGYRADLIDKQVLGRAMTLLKTTFPRVLIGAVVALPVCALYIHSLARNLEDGTNLLDFIWPLIPGVLGGFCLLALAFFPLVKARWVMLLTVPAAAAMTYELGSSGVREIRNNQLVSLQVVFERCVEQSYPAYRDRTICADGTWSESVGRGSCSWHGGTVGRLPRPARTMSDDQCMVRARSVSWLD